MGVGGGGLVCGEGRGGMGYRGRGLLDLGWWMRTGYGDGGRGGRREGSLTEKGSTCA